MDLNPTAGSLLGFLYSYGPMSGWDLTQAVEASIGYFWNVTRSQVYRELARLDEAGLVEAGDEGPRARRPFKVTSEGARAFVDWLMLDPGEDLIRLPLLLKFFFGDHLGEDSLRRFADQARPAHVARLATFVELESAFRDESPMVAHVVRLGISYEKAVLEWFDSIPWDSAAG